VTERKLSWWQLLDLDWEVEKILIDADWARELRWIERTPEGGEHGRQQDSAAEAERPPGWPERGPDEGEPGASAGR
jgi:hypothetical protein